jgi:hypothetical protein
VLEQYRPYITMMNTRAYVMIKSAPARLMADQRFQHRAIPVEPSVSPGRLRAWRIRR